LATGSYDAPKDLNGAFLFYASTASLNAGVIEEMVVLGFVVVTLQQARRPLWEIVLIGLVLRSSYHIYYGPVFLWLFLRTRSLLPIIAVHFCWDFTVFMASRWNWIAVIALLVVLGLVVASPITWLVERNNRTASPWALYPPPGALARRAMPGGGVVGPAARAGGGVLPGGGAAQPGGPNPPPGWQPDPWGQWRWRWWDGVAWTDATA
jgi:hypothetical protein